MPKLSDILWDYLPDKQAMQGMGNDLLAALNRGGVAGVLGAPVDIANQLANLGRALYGYAGNKAGVLSADQMPQLEDKPIGGSEWIGQKMQDAGLINNNRNALAELLAGMVMPGAMLKGGVKANQAMDAAIANAQRPNTLNTPGYKGQRGAAALPDLPMDEESRMERMKSLGLERGWYRGGPRPNEAGNKTGNFYTLSPDEAAGYAKRFKNPDVREYAIPTGPYLQSDRGYKPRLGEALAKILEDPYYGKEGARLAKEFRSYGPDEYINGSAIMQSLEAAFGNQGMGEVLDKLKYFKGAMGHLNNGEVQLFPSAMVRDANKAKFDPAASMKNDIYGHATPGGMAATAANSLAGLLALRRILDDEGKKQ